jgi:hypothetical protein
MRAGVLKMLAVRGTIDRILASGAAANWANIAADTRTIPARAFFLADPTGDVHGRMISS